MTCGCAPWHYDFTCEMGRPIRQGTDFIQVVEFPIAGGIAQDWSGFAVRAQGRAGTLDVAPDVLFDINCTILDARRRIVRYHVPFSVTKLIVVEEGVWDSELYQYDADGNETLVARYVDGRWDLSKEITD